jgi:hypothetical protein
MYHVGTERFTLTKTGDCCQTAGLYFGHGGCGHAAQLTLARQESFPECKVCGGAVNWTLLRPTECESGDP